MDGTQVLATVEERGDLMRLLESAWCVPGLVSIHAFRLCSSDG
jgi:hypothetical protein